MTVALLVLDYAPKKLVSNQGRTETLKRGGEIRRADIEKNTLFVKSLQKCTKRGEGEVHRPPHPLYAYVSHVEKKHLWLKGKSFCEFSTVFTLCREQLFINPFIASQVTKLCCLFKVQNTTFSTVGFIYIRQNMPSNGSQS